MSSSSTGSSVLPPPDDTSTTTDAAAHPFVQFHGLVNGSWFIFFVISVASSKLGGFARHVGMPLITGYMVCGVLTGPFVLDMVQTYQIPDLAYVTQTALAFIALSAGSELYLPELRSLFKSIAYLAFTTSTVSYLVCAFMMFSMSTSPLTDWMRDYDSNCRMMISLVAGSIMVARSPASAIAVVKELNAHGKLTSCMLGVTVVSDVIVLILYALSSSLALAVCGGNGFKGAEFLLTILSLILAVGIGYAFGYLFILLLWAPRAPWAKYTILPCGLLIFILCDWFQLYSSRVWGIGISFDALLICITAGYVVTNQSHNRIAFMMMLGELGPYVFIPFFVKVGVELNLKVLYQSIGFAIILFFIRAFCMIVGGWAGGKCSGLSDEHSHIIGLTMLSQAGVSLGLASEVSVKFGSSFGPAFQTAIISIVIINQIIGPILCKYAIKRAKENERLGPDGLPLEDGIHARDDLNGPDLQLSYESEDFNEEDMRNLENGVVPSPSDAAGSPAAPSQMTHRRGSTRGSFSMDSGGHNRYVFTNVHGARFKKMTKKRLLIVGIDAVTLAIAQRLIDSDVWSIVLLDESSDNVSKAERILLTPSHSRQVRGKIIDPLPGLLRKVSEFASKFPAGIGSVVDALIPQDADAAATDRLIDASGAPTSHATPNKNVAGGGSAPSSSSKPGRSASASPILEEEEEDEEKGMSSPSGSVKIHARSASRSGGFTELKETDEELVFDASDDTARDNSGSNDMPPSPSNGSARTGTGAAKLHRASSSGGAASSVSPAGPLPLNALVQIHRLNVDAHRTFLDAYKNVEDELFLSRDTTDAVLLALRVDSVAYDLAKHLTDRRRFSKVLAKIQQPQWGSVFSGLGVIPLFALSLEAQLVTQLLSDEVAQRVGGANKSPDSGSSDNDITFVSAVSAALGMSANSLTGAGGSGASGFSNSASILAAAASLNTSDVVCSVIRPEEDYACFVVDMEPTTRAEFQRLHASPPPHLTTERPAQFRDGLKHHQRVGLNVVSEAHRDNYMNAILHVHQHAEKGLEESAEEKENRNAVQQQMTWSLSGLRHQQKQTKLQRANSNAGSNPTTPRVGNATSSSTPSSAAPSPNPEPL